MVGHLRRIRRRRSRNVLDSHRLGCGPNKADWTCAVTKEYFFLERRTKGSLGATSVTKDRAYVPFEQICGNALRDDFFVGFNGIQKTVAHLSGDLETDVQ
jgi:hypothetical protein